MAETLYVLAQNLQNVSYFFNDGQRAKRRLFFPGPSPSGSGYLPKPIIVILFRLTFKLPSLLHTHRAWLPRAHAKLGLALPGCCLPQLVFDVYPSLFGFNLSNKRLNTWWWHGEIPLLFFSVNKGWTDSIFVVKKGRTTSMVLWSHVAWIASPQTTLVGMGLLNSPLSSTNNLPSSKISLVCTLKWLVGNVCVWSTW